MSHDLPTATGSFGDKPQITFPDSPPPPELATAVLSRGDGPLVEDGQLIDVDYLGQIWGGSVFDNSYDRGSSIQFGIGVGQVIAGWDGGEDTLVFVVDIKGVD